MPKQIFHRIHAAIENQDNFREGAKEAKGKPGARARIELRAFLRILVYRMSFDEGSELCQLRKATGLKAFLGYIDFFWSAFETNI